MFVKQLLFLFIFGRILAGYSSLIKNNFSHFILCETFYITLELFNF